MDFHKWLGKGSLSLWCLSFGPLFLYSLFCFSTWITEHSKSFISRWHANSCSQDLRLDWFWCCWYRLTRAKGLCFPAWTHSPFFFLSHLMYSFNVCFVNEKTVSLQSGSLHYDRSLGLYMSVYKYKIALIFYSWNAYWMRKLQNRESI